jgi:hypothetical protein
MARRDTLKPKCSRAYRASPLTIDVRRRIEVVAKHVVTTADLQAKDD